MGNNRDLARFESKFEHAECGCWIWKAGLKGGGYGVFWLDGALRGAHRAALFLFKGHALNTPLDAMHSCDTPACVNPEHLSYGTKIDNMRDAARKGRTVNVTDWRGCRNPKAKLTPEKVSEIRVRLEAGETPLSIARHFGVTGGRISQLRKSGWDC